jgi:adenylate cyclase
MNRQRAKEHWRVVALVTFSSIILAYVLSSLVMIENLQYKAVNTLFNLRGPVTPPDTSIVIVALDDQSLASLPGKMPYPRSYYVAMLDHLAAAGARLIVFDIEFTEPGIERPAEDLALASAVQRIGNVVLAGKVVLDIGSRLANNQHILEPVPPLMQTRAALGLVNVVEDTDGFIRNYILFQQSGRKTYYTLAVQAARVLANESGDALPENWSEAFRIGGVEIPRSQANTMYINFRGPAGTFRTYSLASVLDDSTFALDGEEDTDIFTQYLEWGTFRDKIVFVGASAEELQDNKLTPFFEWEGVKHKMPGVELHANALSTLLRRDFIRPLPAWMALLLSFLLAFSAGFLSRWLQGFRGLVAILFVAVLFSIAVFITFSHFRIILPLTAPMISLALATFGQISYQVVVEQREKKFIRQTFQQYVAPSVVEKMLSSGELPSFGGERKELSVLFSDIRNFTRFSESHEPEVVASRLSEYLSAMVEIIFKYNGTLDKFVGDAIMALYGAPYYSEDHAERACRSALEMQRGLRELQKSWPDEALMRFNIGIGINTGKMIVGNLGSQQLFDYTVIGDQVNLASRLEGANKEYETGIIISENTYAQVASVALVRELDKVRLVGRTQALRIYELRSMDSLPQLEQDYLIDVYSEGLAAYRERRWSDALIAFRRVLRYFPHDGPAKMYTVRCLNFLEQPAPADWDGVYDMKQK